MNYNNDIFKINPNVCCLCNNVINYPEGVYLKNGQEVHIKCIQEKRKELKNKGD